MLSASEIAGLIDLSCVRASHTEQEILAVAEAAKKYNCAAVFALPAHTPLLIEALADNPDVVVGGVVGFPDGSATTTGKVQEAKEMTPLPDA